MMPTFQYIKVKQVKEGVKQLSTAGAKIQAGGTDLLGCLRDRVFPVEKVVSINGIRDLRGISDKGGVLRIGALTTITEVAENPQISQLFPGLARAAGEVASPQLRNQGTIGGNICQKPRCWYYRGEFHCTRKGGDICFAYSGENQYHCLFGGAGCYIVHPSDTAPVLAALEARVGVIGPKGARIIKMDEFFMPPAMDPTRETVLGGQEMVTEILIPLPRPGLKSSYRKVRARRSWDFALAGAALALNFEGPRVVKARVFLSGVAPVPWRAKEVEEVITGRELTAGTIARAGMVAIKKAEPLSKNGYKVPLLQAVIEEELEAIRQ
ncbi:MAG: xanthine dehydrogenase family protein subunit M [Deltaproteobacteria bacterium]|nr:xanthine dehydrogenase family protein subunit M [Deltaproteobacteria bacterium]